MFNFYSHNVYASSKKINHWFNNLNVPETNRRLFNYFLGWNNLGWKSKAKGYVSGFVKSVDMI